MSEKILNALATSSASKSTITKWQNKEHGKDQGDLQYI